MGCFDSNSFGGDLFAGTVDPGGFLGVRDGAEWYDAFTSPPGMYREGQNETSLAELNDRLNNPLLAEDSMGRDVLSWLTGYTEAVTDPRLNQMLIGAEREYRPQWTELGLADQENTLFGTENQAGTLSMLERMTPRLGAIQADAASAQRRADLGDVEALGGRATAVVRGADPAQAALIGRQEQLTNQLYDRAQGVTPEQARMAEQSARSAGMARGRAFDNTSIFSEALGRETYMRQNRAEAMGAGSQLFGMYEATNADPFQAILGRPSTYANMAQQQQAYGGGLAGSLLGPQVYDPNAGINVGLQRQANLLNYNAALAGAESSEDAGMISGLGSLGGAALMAFAMMCWVAREVYGEDNPKWKQFRLWLLTMSPDWFYRWYAKHGEQFAKWISDKPIIKRGIRIWMDSRIKKLHKGIEEELSYGI